MLREASKKELLQKIFGGTPDSGKWYLIQWKVPDFMNAGMHM